MGRAILELVLLIGIPIVVVIWTFLKQTGAEFSAEAPKLIGRGLAVVLTFGLVYLIAEMIASGLGLIIATPITAGTGFYVFRK